MHVTTPYRNPGRLITSAGTLAVLALATSPALAQQSLPQDATAGAGQPEDEVVREARPSQSVQDVLREEHALFSDRLTIEPGITYSYSDRSQLALSGFLALDAIFLGNISVEDVSSHTTTFDVSTRYGVTDRLELELNVPFVYRKSQYRALGRDFDADESLEASVDEADLGDVSASLYYRVLTETESRPDVVWNLGVTAPTGQHPFGIATRTVDGGEGEAGNLTIPTELPTGNGVWGVSTGVSLLKTFDPAIIFGNLGYQHNIERSFSDISAEEGQQPGRVDLGDSVRFGFGTAFALNEEFSLSLSYSHQHIRKSSTTQNGETRSVIGSDANVGTMNFGATYALSDTTSIVTNIGVGVTDDASDITLSFRMPIQF